MRSALVFAVVALVACGSETPAGDDSTIVIGTWSYDARQATPAIELTGQLRIERQSNGRIEGELNAQEKDAQGMMRTRVGVVSGRVLADGALDFDVLLQGTATARRHVGRVRGDSITGTWAETTLGAPLSGPFSARRSGQ